MKNNADNGHLVQGKTSISVAVTLLSSRDTIDAFYICVVADLLSTGLAGLRLVNRNVM